MPDRLKSIHWPVTLTVVIAAILVLAVASVVPPLWLLGQHLRSLLWGAVVLAAGFMQGWIFINLLVQNKIKDDPALSAVLATGLGLGFLSLELLFLGLAGFFTRPAITLTVLVMFCAGLAVIWLLKTGLPEVTITGKSGVALPLGLTGLAAFFNLYFALVPPVFFDAMSYHLELPSRYLQSGRIFHITENLYSGYPQLVEVLYGIGLGLSGVGGAGVISLIGYLLSMGLVWTWTQRKFDTECAAWATAMVSFTPPLMLLVGFYHNEWFLTFFTLATVMIIAESDRTPGTMLLAGCTAGLAAGSKYTALAFALAVPFLAGAGLDLYHKRRSAMKGWLIFAFSAVLVASPWYLKNLFFTGDPLYPLLSGLAGDVSGFSDLARDTHFKGLHLADLWRWLLIPYQAIFRPWDIQLPMSLGVLFFALIPALFSLRRKQQFNTFLIGWIVGSFAIWYVTFRAGRFALPMIVLFMIWLAAGFRFTARTVPGAGRFLTGAVIFLLFINLAQVIGFLSSYAGVLNGAFGKVTKEQYLSQTYAPYGAINYLNQLDPPPEKVLFLGEMKGFYSDFPREVATFEVPNRLVELIRRGAAVDEIAEKLLASGFSHILYNPIEMERLAPKSSQLRLDSSEEEAMHTFLGERAIKVFAHSDISVWKIKDD